MSTILIECNCRPLVPNSHADDCPTYLAIVASIKELEDRDHGFLSEKQAASITEPFGFRGATYLAKANPNDFKGLSLWDENGNPVSELRGQAAHKVAMQICERLGVEFPEMNGIGSQLHACVSALRKFWGIK